MKRAKKFSAFTLIEVLVTVIIIGTLAAIALPVYSKTKEHALGKDAAANLKLIAAAEKIYHMNNDTYIGCLCSSDVECNGAGGCNTILKTSLVTENWTHQVDQATAAAFRARSWRKGSGGYLDCVYTMTQADDDPTGSGCP